MLSWESLDILFSSLRILITFILALEIAIDFFLTLNNGLGAFVHEKYYGDVSQLPGMYSGIILISIIGMFFIKMLDLISSKLILWKQRI